MDELLTGKICPYCGRSTEYVDSSVIYGRSYGMIYLCRDCRAYVGVHKGTDQALGRLANAELREAKKEAHFYFDQVAKTNLINKFGRNISPTLQTETKPTCGYPINWAYHVSFAISECLMWRIVNKLLNCVNQ